VYKRQVYDLWNGRLKVSGFIGDDILRQCFRVLDSEIFDDDFPSDEKEVKNGNH
jgi:hypothetical protein